MIASGGRGEKSRRLLEDLGSREWGLQVLDEVHQVVAAKFSSALKLRCHARLGLTATLVREDEKQKNLSFMLGPKLYEANWKDLTKEGFLANVQVCGGLCVCVCVCNCNCNCVIVIVCVKPCTTPPQHTLLMH